MLNWNGIKKNLKDNGPYKHMLNCQFENIYRGNEFVSSVVF